MSSKKNTVRTEVFIGHGIRWTRGGGGDQPSIHHLVGPLNYSLLQQPLKGAFVQSLS